MKLQQLRYIIEVINHNLNISSAAEGLYTSQPGISKQIRMLENELGVQIFIRKGKHLIKVTKIGNDIILIARDILRQINNIKSIASEKTLTKESLYIATTYTQAKYALPKIIEKFVKQYPKISLHIQEGPPEYLANITINGLADLIISTDTQYLNDNLIMLPCYNWKYILIMLPNHPLSKKNIITTDELSMYPLITYNTGSKKSSEIELIFKKSGLSSNIIFTTSDSDIIKTYVRMELGIGLIANMAINNETDSDFIKINIDNILNYRTIKIGFRKFTYLRPYIYNFINLFSPHLTRNIVDAAIKLNLNNKITEIFKDTLLPIK